MLRNLQPPQDVIDALQGAPLFHLSRSLLSSLDYNDVAAIVGDLSTLDMLKLPYEGLIAIRGWLPLIMGGDERWPKIHMTGFVQGPLQVTCRVGTHLKAILTRSHWVHFEMPDGQTVWENIATPTAPGLNVEGLLIEFYEIMTRLALVLVSSLAVRNVVKQTAVNSRIGTGKPVKSAFRGPSGITYISRTILDVPQAQTGTGSGTSPRPHLRRGHIHAFLTGPGRVNSVQKWVAPIFVNADGSPLAPKVYKV